MLERIEYDDDNDRSLTGDGQKSAGENELGKDCDGIQKRRSSLQRELFQLSRR